LILGWGVEAARVRVIYSGVPPDRTCSESRDQARERLGWGREERCLLAVARLTAWKGVDLLIEAASRVPRVRLVVAGDGPARSALAAQAAARRAPVEFLGTVPRERIAVHLRATDYVVVYSGYEGLSHTILEALHTGTPIIASDRGGNPEIVRDGENGLLVPYPDVEALEAAIRRAFEPGTRARLAADAARGLERFSWPAVARSIVDEVESAGDRRCGF
jgi:glycosyltransferase involved in cell wall biosynthesis